MPGIGGRQFTCGDFQNPQPYRDEHFLRIACTDLAVYKLQGPGRTLFTHGRVTEKRRRHHHEKGGRNSFSGHISDHQSQMVFVDQEKVVKISADFFGRLHGCINVELRAVRKWGKFFGKRIGLDFGGQAEFGFDPFLFKRQLPSFLRCHGIVNCQRDHIQ